MECSIFSVIWVELVATVVPITLVEPIPPLELAPAIPDKINRSWNRT